MLCHCRYFTNMIGISKTLSCNKQGYLHCTEEIETRYSLKCKLTLNLEVASQKKDWNELPRQWWNRVLYLCTQCASFLGKVTSVSYGYHSLLASNWLSGKKLKRNRLIGVILRKCNCWVSHPLKQIIICILMKKQFWSIDSILIGKTSSSFLIFSSWFIASMRNLRKKSCDTGFTINLFPDLQVIHKKRLPETQILLPKYQLRSISMGRLRAMTQSDKGSEKKTATQLTKIRTQHAGLSTVNSIASYKCR